MARDIKRIDEAQPIWWKLSNSVNENLAYFLKKVREAFQKTLKSKIEVFNSKKTQTFRLKQSLFYRIQIKTLNGQNDGKL